jgi:Predicted membrane protein/domain
MTQPAGWPQPPAGAPPSGGWAQQTQVGPAPGLVYGGFWIRLVAYIIDAVLIGIIETILISVAGTAGQGIAGIIGIVYFIGMWGTTGQTVGMMPFGLRVVRNSDGGKLTWGNAILRFVGLIIAFVVIFIGVIWVAFDSRKRGWHDMIGGTVVVRSA